MSSSSSSKRFHNRPFIWHIWDGRKDGFSCPVNYHKLNHKRLETLTYQHASCAVVRESINVDLTCFSWFWSDKVRVACPTGTSCFIAGKECNQGTPLLSAPDRPVPLLGISTAVRLYSYVVARDYGFAPNPFFGFCTLATCKPIIRKMAKVGDWIVGTGSKTYQRDGHLVYAMKVSEILTYDQYWRDPRFRQKRPNLRGSLKQGYGDNIYHRDPKTRQWIQENSHHSYPNGRPNPNNIKHDTQTSNVLIGAEFSYWGGSGPKIPVRFCDYKDFDICIHGPGHKCNFPQALIDSFVAWIRSLDGKGYVGDPAEFDT